MVPDTDGEIDGNRCLSQTPPLEFTKRAALGAGCDMAVPCGAGIGNALMHTRVVEEYARKIGRPIRLLTAPLMPPIGRVEEEEPFPLWRCNPFVSEIVNADLIDKSIILNINKEQDNLVHFSHMIENISFYYGIRPRTLRPSLFLSESEQEWGLDILKNLRRPLICIHPYGTSAPLLNHPWYLRNWERLCSVLSPRFGFVQVGKVGTDEKPISVPRFRTTIRQMMAIIWASDLFVGFDSSPAHVATAFEVPALVLWDPLRKGQIEERWQAGFAAAALSRWSYPQNKNIVLLGDRDDAICNLIIAWVEERSRSMYA